MGLLLAAASGCGGGKTGNISGTVTFQGKPMPGGYVNFYSVGPDGKVLTQKSAPIDAQGNYSLAKVPVGDAKITVQAPAGDIRDVKTEKGGMPVRQKQTLVLPQRYEMVEQTDLKYTVTPGNQTHEIVLK